MNGARNKLKRLIESNDLSIGVGARDALEAKLIENAGFDFIWASGFDISASYAVPDASLISMKQLLEAARSMCEVIGIPILADCDTGYGNVNNLIYAVKLFEQAGMEGICIEDKKFPKDTSLLPGAKQELTPVREFVGKIKAATDTRRNENLVIVARVEALIAGRGEAEALERGARYVEAGADLVLIHSKSKTPDEIVSFVKNWKESVPLVIIPTAYPQLTEKEIRELDKVKLVIYANQVLRSGIKAQELLLQKIKKSEGIREIEDMMVPVSHVFELQDVPKLKENETKYMGS